MGPIVGLTGKVFKALKFFASDQTLSVDGSIDDLNSTKLSVLNPLEVDEGLLVEFPIESNPMDFIRCIEISDRQAPGESVGADFGWRSNFRPDWSFEQVRGQITRIGMVTQGSRDWQIVGLPREGDIIALLKDTDEEHAASSRYFCDRVVASFSFHTEGAGPISWDGGSAVLAVDDWWILANEGDRQGDDRVINSPADQILAIVDWLQKENAVNLFLLHNLRCNWLDELQVHRLEAVLAELEELAFVNVFLSSEDLEKVSAALIRGDRALKGLVEILGDPAGRQADSLIDVLALAVNSDSAGSIIHAKDLAADAIRLGEERQ